MQPIHSAVSEAVQTKVELFTTDVPRFAVRGVLAGAYLTLGTALAAVAGHTVEQYAPGIGLLVFAALFGLGLFAIVILDADLATGNMMFMSYGLVSRQVGWAVAAGILLVSTVANIVGALLVGLALGQATRFTGLGPDHLIGMLTELKMAKTPGTELPEAVLANFVVNMAVVGALRTRDLVGRFVVILPFIAIFVGLGLEHVIANISLFSLAVFSLTPLPDGFTLGATAANLSVVWIGNLVGGGVLIGGVYAWLHRR